jgi:hypothetical protein
MRSNFSVHAPELLGVAILGATLGAVVCGAGRTGLNAGDIAGALAGAIVLPLLAAFRWDRLLQRFPHRGAAVRP